MTEEFLPNPNEEQNPPLYNQSQNQAPPDRELLKHLLIGSPKGVTSAIHALHTRGYAEATAWTPLQPTANPGEVISVLRRYIRRQ